MFCRHLFHLSPLLFLYMIFHHSFLKTFDWCWLLWRRLWARCVRRMLLCVKSCKLSRLNSKLASKQALILFELSYNLKYLRDCPSCSTRCLSLRITPKADHTHNIHFFPSRCETHMRLLWTFLNFFIWNPEVSIIKIHLGWLNAVFHCLHRSALTLQFTCFSLASKWTFSNTLDYIMKVQTSTY